ncbi:hypothetical protein [Xanthomonas campestris]|uniref:hypothetical protein n=1 Tax=Xanthomonas campestris TaxID=339 RepID=UPI000E1F2188|nr:hypothetical protein [Xanthomonas campestris]
MLVRIMIHAACAAALVMMAITGGEPALIHEMDPSITAQAIENGSGNQVVFAAVLFAAVAALQAVLLIRARSGGGRVLPIGMMVVGAVLLLNSGAP